MKNPYRYNAERVDYIPGIADFQYLRARYYTPDTARFIQQDTVWGKIEVPLSQNLYAYCGNNPVNFVDPSGHMAVEELNTIATAHRIGRISKEEVAGIILLRETIGRPVDSLISAYDKGFISEKADFEDTYRQVRNMGNKDKQMFGQNLDLAFHEITQVLALKELAYAYPNKQPARLETRIDNVTNIIEADVTLGAQGTGFVYEVKPVHSINSSSTNRQLNKYAGTNEEIFTFGQFPSYFGTGGNGKPINLAKMVKLFQIGDKDVYQGYTNAGQGKIGYYLYLVDKNDERNKCGEFMDSPHTMVGSWANYFNLTFDYTNASQQTIQTAMQYSTISTGLVGGAVIGGLSTGVFGGLFAGANGSVANGGTATIIDITERLVRLLLEAS